jgi:hypothetical protein
MGFAAVVAIVAVVATQPQQADNASSGAGGTASSAARPTAGSDEAAPKANSGASSSLSSPPIVPPGPGGGSPGSDSRSKRLQERSAALTLAARPRDIETVADGIVRVTDAAGGFVASSTVSNDGGDFELRVPTARLQKTIADLSRLAHVRARSQSTRDITAEGVSARGRVREYEKERLGLLRALARATTLNETDAIKARLRMVNASLAAARQSLRQVDNRAAFANVSVTLVPDHSAGAPGGGSSWTPGDALHDAVRVLEVTAGVLLIALAILLPVGLVAGLAVLAGRATTRRRRARALDAV